MIVQQLLLKIKELLFSRRNYFFFSLLALLLLITTPAIFNNFSNRSSETKTTASKIRDNISKKEESLSSRLLSLVKRESDSKPSASANNQDTSLNTNQNTPSAGSSATVTK